MIIIELFYCNVPINLFWDEEHGTGFGAKKAAKMDEEIKLPRVLGLRKNLTILAKLLNWKVNYKMRISITIRFDKSLIFPPPLKSSSRLCCSSRA